MFILYVTQEVLHTCKLKMGLLWQWIGAAGGCSEFHSAPSDLPTEILTKT